MLQSQTAIHLIVSSKYSLYLSPSGGSNRAQGMRSPTVPSKGSAASGSLPPQGGCQPLDSSATLAAGR
eukprot:3328454-Alexandrium_andersonii.AAC.1